MEDPTIQSLIRKVKVLVHKDMEKAYHNNRSHGVIMEIRMSNGRKYCSTVLYPKGHPKNPATKKELEKKFTDLVSTVLTERQIENVITTVSKLELLKDINELTEMLHP